MTTAGSRWGVVMSRNSGYSEQVLWKLFLANAQLNTYFAMVLLVAAAYRTVFETIWFLNRSDSLQETGYIIELCGI